MTRKTRRGRPNLGRMGGPHRTTTRHATAAAAHRALVETVSTAALDLPDPRCVVELAAQEAIELGRFTTALGVTALGLAVVCIEAHDECFARYGAISCVPDLVEAEWAANGFNAPTLPLRVVREDGRSVAVVFSTTPPAGGAR